LRQTYVVDIKQEIAMARCCRPTTKLGTAKKKVARKAKTAKKTVKKAKKAKKKKAAKKKRR